MEAYLDNSATTRVDAQVQELMKKLMDVDFGNQSSRHQKGVVAEGYIKEARQKIAATLKVTTPDALPRILDPKNVAMLTGHKVFSEAEIESRCEIMLDNYCKTVHIEAQTMIDMARKQILPAVESYAAKLAETLATKKALSPLLGGKYETSLLTKLSGLTDDIAEAADALEASLVAYHKIGDVTEAACFIRDEVLPKMDALRAPADEAQEVYVTD